MNLMALNVLSNIHRTNIMASMRLSKKLDMLSIQNCIRNMVLTVGIINMDHMDMVVDMEPQAIVISNNTKDILKKLFRLCEPKAYKIFSI